MQNAKGAAEFCQTREAWGPSLGNSSDTLPLLKKELHLPFLRYLAVLTLLLVQCPAHADSLSELSDSFWQWRAQEQPFSDDDIPRIERPTGLSVDWSPQTITRPAQQPHG